MIRYAGYKQPDGSVIGDPANVEFTEVCAFIFQNINQQTRKQGSHFHWKNWITGENERSFLVREFKNFARKSVNLDQSRESQGKLCKKMTNIIYMVTKRIVASVLYFS